MKVLRTNRARIKAIVTLGCTVLCLFALVFAPRPQRVAPPRVQPSLRLAANDDGPVSDDEPAVEDEDDNGGDVSGTDDVADTDHDNMTDAPGTTPTTAKPATATATATATAPPKGKSLGDGTFLAPFTSADGVKTFHLTMMETKWETTAGQVFDAYTFNGIIPGPVIRVNEGDKVRIVVKNELPISTGVHWHGMILPNSQDGIPGLTQKSINQGDTYTYTFTAIAPGTHWYHSHSSGSDIGRGLYGGLEVVPKSGDFKVDRDYRLFVGDTNLGFVMNGKAYPYTTPLAARVGEKVRIRLIAAGDLSHPMHLHGSTFKVVAQDGNPIEHPLMMDTLLISAGQTFDIIAEPTVEGRWLLHCHIFAHSHAATADAMHDMHASVNGVAMGMNGITTTLDVSSATRPLSPATTIAPASDTPGTTAPPAAQPAPSSAALSTTPAAAASDNTNGLLIVAGVLILAFGLFYVTGRKSA